jgi:HD-GYP domain-containing protein (c-di-GMP phosphodiesterase class II)
MLPRIITVADTFDAMTTNRPYQKGMEPDYAVQLITSLAAKKFDPRVVAALQKVFERGDMGVRRTAAAAPVKPARDEAFETARGEVIAEL